MTSKIKVVEFKSKLNKVNKSYGEYIKAKGNLERLLSQYIDFDFSIEDMPGDGFVVLDAENASVAKVEDCFNHIVNNGTLTQDDLQEICF